MTNKIPTLLRNFGVTVALLSAFAGFAPSTASAAATAGQCNVAGVTEVGDRVQVQCAQKLAGTIEYFVLSTGSASRADRLLSVANAALLSGKLFWVSFDTTAGAGANQGFSWCPTANCRVIGNFGILR